MTEPAAAAPSTPIPVPATTSGRIQLVDLARGIALLAMFVFHFAYDLSNFGLIETDIAFEPGWRLFARCIAGSFLVIVGASLVLATRKGLNRSAFLKRLAMVVAAAAAVTIGTFFAMRDNFIFFGILHHVALASVLALPFLRLPIVLVVLAAVIAFALPAFVDLPLFDQPWAVWLGFSHAPIQTADFVPVFPWFGCVLTGIALARLVLPRLDGTAAAGWRPGSRPARIICWGGRHSLLVYLVHQPVFIGLIMLATQVVTPLSPDERAFRGECQRSCTGPSLSGQACQEICSCTVDGLKRENLWQKALANTLSSEESARMTRLAQACLRGP